MKKLTNWVLFTRIYLGFSMLSLLSVSVMALVDPQSVMELVDVQLGNNDALSSI